MKVRLGFVSNSSSSSFCIYGVSMKKEEVETPELLQFMIKPLNYVNTPEEAKRLIKREGFDLWDAIMSEMDLEAWWVDWHEKYYFGKSWPSIKDSQTAREFKDEIESTLKKVFPEAKGFSSYLEQYET